MYSVVEWDTVWIGIANYVIYSLVVAAFHILGGMLTSLKFEGALGKRRNPAIPDMSYQCQEIDTDIVVFLM